MPTPTGAMAPALWKRWPRQLVSEAIATSSSQITPRAWAWPTVVALLLVFLLYHRPRGTVLLVGLLGFAAMLGGAALFFLTERATVRGPRVVLSPAGAISLADGSSGTAQVISASPSSCSTAPAIIWTDGVLTLTGQAPLPYPPNATRPDLDRAEARRAARRQATQAFAQYLAQLRQFAPAYLADVQGLLQRLPDVEHARVAEALVNEAATIRELESDVGCTVRVAIGRDRLRDALGAGRRYARQGQSRAAALAAVGLVILSGAVLRASTRRVRAARR